MGKRKINNIIFCTALLLITMEALTQDKFMEVSYPYDMKYQEVGEGMVMAYADIGSGETILFIHGMGSYAPAWKKNVKELSKSYRCIVVDLVGYGKSSKGKYPASMSFHTANLFALMDALEVKGFNIAGHSMGAQIAMHMVLDQPERINSLMMMAPAGIETFNDQEKQFFMAMTPEVVAAVPDEQYRHNLALNFYHMSEDAEFMYSDRMLIKQDSQFIDYCHTVVEGVRGMLNEPVFHRLSEIDIPVLVLYGVGDKLIPNKYLHTTLTTEDIASLAEENIPNASVHLVEEAGHFVHFEQPEIANSLITDFLNKNSNK